MRKMEVSEHHVPCPYQDTCYSPDGFCHRWKSETIIRHDGRLMVRKEIYDCDKPLEKI